MTDKLTPEQRLREDIIEIVWEYSNSDMAFEIADKLIAYLNALTAEDEPKGTVSWCGICQKPMVERTFNQIAKRKYLEYVAIYGIHQPLRLQPMEYIDWLDREE